MICNQPFPMGAGIALCITFGRGSAIGGGLETPGGPAA